ncbi:MAG: FAD-binding oxidoreductase [Thermaceae bacterium]|nr:FAD-binding oxidoreductase [Thermaceae bacterium]
MLGKLKTLLADKVSTVSADLESHSHDESYPLHRLPMAVVYAQSLLDIRQTLAWAREALAWAREAHIPVIPFGAGTSLEGHIVPQTPCISLDLSRMNRVLQVLPADFLVVVEPGVSREALNLALKGTGLFFPVDPGANASLGGMAATNASGTTTLRYGGMRPNVLALEVVLTNGEVLELGRRTRKTSAGYDLKDLFIGSEGTLGVITQLTLRLHPLPAYVHALRVFFASLETAAEAAYALLGSGLPLARLELLDELSLRAINRYLGHDYPQKPALFVEFHSSTKAALEGESRAALELVNAVGAIAVDTAITQEERSAQWEARHQLYWALVAQYPGHQFMITDTAVPISRMPELVRYAQGLLGQMNLGGSIIGHVGDGNFHSLVATNETRYPEAEAYAMRLVEKALELGGTSTGEHGVGLRKKKYLAPEHGVALGWMRQIKQLFDPENLLNPGKIL